MKKEFEVIIIGGSYAGLSAAMALGRASRNVLVIDHGKPCNAPTPHSHNFLTRDGETPAAISAIAKEQVLHYPTVTFLDGKVVKADKSANGFVVKTQNGDSINAKKLLIATGIKDIMPDIEGFANCWGKSVIHCPYCHGYEVKGEKTAVITNGDVGMHYAMVLQQWATDLTFFTNGPATFTEEQRAKLQQHNIAVVETPITKLIQHNGKLEQIVLADGTSHDIPVIYHKPAFTLHEFVQKLNPALDDFGYVKVDDMQRTSLPGVFAAGDCCSMMRALPNAVATGNKAGAIINMELSAESF